MKKCITRCFIWQITHLYRKKRVALRWVVSETSVEWPCKWTYPKWSNKCGRPLLNMIEPWLRTTSRSWTDSFGTHQKTVRYGVADIQYGGEALYKWRASAQPVTPPRERQHTIITTFGSDFATVSTEFTNDADTSLRGRQMQSWARIGSTSDVDHGWKIVAAHVSLV